MYSESSEDLLQSIKLNKILIKNKKTHYLFLPVPRDDILYYTSNLTSSEIK